VSVTPISLAVMMASVANGGTRIVPHLVRAVDNGKGWEQLPPPGGQKNLGMSPEHVDVVREGLWMVVNGAGTGGRASPSRPRTNVTAAARRRSAARPRRSVRRSGRGMTRSLHRPRPQGARSGTAITR
jgi:membrane peptidoglycan carboxypeptidase